MAIHFETETLKMQPLCPKSSSILVRSILSSGKKLDMLVFFFFCFDRYGNTERHRIVEDKLMRQKARMLLDEAASWSLMWYLYGKGNQSITFDHSYKIDFYLILKIEGSCQVRCNISRITEFKESIA